MLENKENFGKEKKPPVYFYGLIGGVICGFGGAVVGTLWMLSLYPWEEGYGEVFVIFNFSRFLGIGFFAGFFLGAITGGIVGIYKRREKRVLK